MIKPLKSLTLKNDNGEDTTYVVASAPAIVETIEPASVASFADGAEGIPVSSLIADINPVQAGSGDPSPSNVRPITGWTGMNVVVSPTLDAQDGTTYPISWEDEAGTVYGGTLDVTNGLLTVDMAIVDLGTLTWSKSGSGDSAFFYSTNNVGMMAGTQNVKCTEYKYTSITTTNTNVGFSITGNPYIRIRDNSYADAAAFKTAMSGVYLVYELATPQTYQLTPQAVLTVLGTNNIWADTGDVEVSYIADTKLYIDKVLTE